MAAKKKATFKNAFPKKSGAPKATTKKGATKTPTLAKAAKTAATQTKFPSLAENATGANVANETKPVSEPTKATANKAEAKPAKEKDPKKMGCLDAAAKVLGESTESMTVRAITDAALAKGYWSTGGKTPHQTLAAALLREIASKGTKSRFAKTERGKFALNGGAK